MKPILSGSFACARAGSASAIGYAASVASAVLRVTRDMIFSSAGLNVRRDCTPGPHPPSPRERARRASAAMPQGSLGMVCLAERRRGIEPDRGLVARDGGEDDDRGEIR